MTTDEAIQEIIDRLTGGGVVKLEVQPQAMRRALNNAFLKMREWYLEKRLIEMISVRGGGSSDNQWLEKADFTQNIRQIYDIYDSQMTWVTADEIESHLMGLTQSLLPVESVIDIAQYTETDRLMENFFSRRIDYKLLDTKVMMSGKIDGLKVAVLYYPEPSTFDDVTVQKAIDWILDYTEARVSIMAARIRGKFRGGDINFESDNSELESNGNEKLISLEEKLQTFQVKFR